MARPAPVLPVPVDLSVLRNASRIINDRLAKDSMIALDLGETLAPPSSHVSASYSVYPHDSNRVPFQKRKLIPVPDGLFAHCKSADTVTHIGLMPEIERAWITYDNNLFFWDYVDGRELSSYMEQNEVINDVQLVKPKKGLFIDEISSLLVVTTPLTVFLLGVSFSSLKGDHAFRDLKLYATDLKINTDIEMISVISTEDGRIFMCGAQDGYLYELHYQETETWFGKRVQLINHSIGGVQSFLPRFTTLAAEDKISDLYIDNYRKCFYALSIKGISIYRQNGEKSIEHVQSITSILKVAQDKVPGHPSLTAQTFVIQSLHVIDPLESRSNIQFFVMTTTGVRLYFGPSNVSNYSFGSAQNVNARSVQLVHVRLPPSHLFYSDSRAQDERSLISLYNASQVPVQPPQRPFQLEKIEKAAYFRGLIVATQREESSGDDYLLCMSPDLSRVSSFGQSSLAEQQVSATTQYEPYRSNLGGGRAVFSESASLLSIPGQTWAMASAAPPSPASSSPNGQTPIPTNELAVQFGEPRYQFMLFTNRGITVLAKRRVVDVLRAVLEEYQIQNAIQPLYDFRDSFGRDQTCCMLLGLACGNSFVEFPNDVSSSANAGIDVSSLAKQTFYELGDRPIWAERTYADAQGIVLFSGRREGLALYFARLIRPLWSIKVVTSLGILNRQKLSVSEEMITTIQKNLFLLKEFLDKNPYLFSSSPNESSSRIPVAEQEVWKMEQASIAELLSLLSRTIEALSFVLLLNDYMLGDLISQCDPEVQKLIANQTFESLITTHDGMTISRALVNVIIDQQIGQQISVDAISEILQQRCGSFCSADDVMLYKAKENIRRAVEAHNITERQNWLADSLRLFVKGARILEFDKLREICGDYQQLGYAKGAIELPLLSAQIVDPDNIGFEAWQACLEPTDSRSELARKRLQCYDLVLDSLLIFEEKCASAKPISLSAPPNNSDPEAVRSHAYELAFASDDQFFHSTFYDWLVNRGLADDLLEMRPPFLEAHLRREPATVQKYQLLWQFYVKSGQPLRAAEVLAALAESTQFDLALETRLEYLTLAVANAKSHPISAAGRHETAIAFLTDLEEKLEVAQVQLEIYNALLPHIDDAPEVRERIEPLEKNLFTMTNLYTQYAIPFDLVDMKLLCLYVSEHRDEGIIRPLWNQIFDEIIREEADAPTTADLISRKVISLGKRFYPSENIFPLRFIATLLVRFALANKEVVVYGWAPRILLQCRVPHADVWDVFHEMYESQVPPFNDQANVQAISSDIAVLLSDWLKEGNRLQTLGEFPVGRIDRAVDQYLAEVGPERTETRTMYEFLKRELRRNW